VNEALRHEADEYVESPLRSEAAAEPPRDDRSASPGPSHTARFQADREDLALRAAPQRVVRFRKGLLVGAATAALALLVGVSWFALDPVGLRIGAGEQDLAPAETASIPDGLEGLPQGYGDGSAPPRLGPPLPGDLGGPILAHQREMAREEATASPSGGTADSDDRAAAERQRIRDEATQARAAPVLMQVSRRSPGERRDAAPDRPASPRPSLGPAVDASGTNTNRLRPPVSRWLISAGSTIAASLITGLNSDIPGMVVAQVTEPAFDSATGRTVLIPQGSRLLGRYESKLAFHQRRAMVVWERLILPDGSSIGLDNSPATDARGFAGLTDRVDFHTWQLLKGIGLSTLIGVGTELSFGEEEDSLLRALRESAQSDADRAGQKITERNLDIAPTITVRPGFPVKVLIHKDLVLPPWQG
jgi:type IV secretion system protein VirB10